MLNKIEIQKELLKTKVMASISHYQSGKLYYKVAVAGGVYQFPIELTEAGPTVNTDESGLSMYDVETVVLSSDLGSTIFNPEIRGSELFRWIKKAIDADDFMLAG